MEPHGINDIEGRGGNDLIDGGFGPDALSGGDGYDTVTYASRAEPVSAAIDGAPNDGTASPRDDRASGPWTRVQRFCAVTTTRG